MKITITPTQITRGGAQKLTVSGDRHLEINGELYAQGTLLAVRNTDNGDIYLTDFTFSGVAAVLAAAPGTGGFFILT